MPSLHANINEFFCSFIYYLLFVFKFVQFELILQTFIDVELTQSYQFRILLIIVNELYKIVNKSSIKYY
jgi:hypothetical protein